jgi:pimeloyl-ACP methyl ester carboxylesterase
MPDKKLIVVHGMGQHDAASVKKEVTEGLTTAFNLYTSLNGTKVDSQIDIVPVAYNSFFDDYRKKLEERSGSLGERLAAIDTSVPFPIDVVKRINNLEADLAKDEFFTTHWLDVILYFLTLLSEPIRLKVAEAIADAIAEVGGANVHVMGHSLGTAVVHDTLAKAYGPDNLLANTGKVLNLSPIEHCLGGVHMVANVSRALQTFVKVGSSIVRPGPLGCTSVFFEYRHRLDPIPKIRPFNPTDNDGWVPHDIFQSVYRLIEPSSVTAANVHDLRHYLITPAVHLPLFRLLFGFRPKKAEQDAAEAAYLANTVLGKAQALQAAFGDLQPTDADSLRAVLDAARALKDMVLGFGEAF